jgi:hypothetical protein
LKKRSLFICALAALVTAGVLAGCGNNYYFAGRVLPPSGIANRVMIAIQNPTALSRGALQIVDAFYDIRQSYNDKIPAFNVSGFSGALPSTIQNMPEEQIGAVYGSGDGSFSVINYQKETFSGSAGTVNGLSSSIFLTRSQAFVFAANQQAETFTVIDKSTGKTYTLSLPGVYKVSVNPGGSEALAFVQNSNYAYYPRKLQSSESNSLAAYYQANHTWPAPYVDCQPQNLPTMCLAQMQDSAGTPLTFDRPVKAVFSSDGSTAYVLNCGAECGGKTSSVTILPTAPLILQSGQQSGSLPSAGSLSQVTLATPGGSSNALVDGNTVYVMGQQLMPDGYFGGHLTVLDYSNYHTGSPISTSNPVNIVGTYSVSDGAAGRATKMILADDNTLWLGTVRCTEGERFNNPSSQVPAGSGYGCLTMFNISTNTVANIEPFQGDLTGIAAVISLHKVYIAEGGQVYIYSTVNSGSFSPTNGAAINNFYVTVTGTAFDVAYMDALTDGDNTYY